MLKVMSMRYIFSEAWLKLYWVYFAALLYFPLWPAGYCFNSINLGTLFAIKMRLQPFPPPRASFPPR
eukprot:scaffold283045_cov17-Tisochrysis_lutea.AAC.1